MNYEKKPMVIEEKSMDIIDTALRTHSFSEAELPVVKRMIHSTGDVEYQEIIRFQHDFMTVASNVIRHGVRIYTDTRMIEAGINKRTLSKLGGEICCLIDTPEAFELAEKKGRRDLRSVLIWQWQRGSMSLSLGMRRPPSSVFWSCIVKGL